MNAAQVYKIIIILLNLATISGGCILIAYGVEYIHNASNDVPILCGLFFGMFSTVLGGIALATSIFGCIGACLNSTLFLKIYAGIFVLLFIFQLSLGIVSINKISNVRSFTYEVYGILDELFEYDQKAFNDVEQQYECCGVNGDMDYRRDYPPSCCENQASPCTTPFSTGCVSAYTIAVKDYFRIIGYVAIVFAAAELMSAFFALAVRKKIKFSNTSKPPTQNEYSGY